MERIPEYRIRWAKVVGSWQGRRRMCIAEKRTRLFWLIPAWVSLEHCNWRDDEASCLVDIRADIEFSAPLPVARKVEICLVDNPEKSGCGVAT